MTYLRRNRGLTMIVCLLVIVGLAVLVQRKMQAATVIPAGTDSWTTAGDGTTSAQVSFPANFFGPGSLAYSGTVTFTGNGTPDTKVQRLDNISVPGTSRLQMSLLSLVSTAPITVTYSDNHTEQWNVAAGLDPNNPSTGSITLNSGGTGSSNLNVIPSFTCTRNGVQKVSSPGVSIPLSCPSLSWSYTGGKLTFPGGAAHTAPNHSHFPQPCTTCE
jgi:hypothetical protein